MNSVEDHDLLIRISQRIDNMERQHVLDIARLRWNINLLTTVLVAALAFATTIIIGTR